MRKVHDIALTTFLGSVNLQLPSDNLIIADFSTVGEKYLSTKHTSYEDLFPKDKVNADRTLADMVIQTQRKNSEL